MILKCNQLNELINKNIRKLLENKLKSFESIYSLQKCKIQTTVSLSGKKNFRKFMIPNKRGQFEHNRLPQPLIDKEFNYPVFRDTLFIRYPGFWFGRKLVYVKEMEPQLIVPDLEGFQLKPYVSYRSPDVLQTQFTARDLFNATIADSIIEKFKSDQQIDVSVDENDVEMAKIRAKQTGSDLFIENNDFGIKS
jgi:large subunit ribosomal protein L41